MVRDNHAAKFVTDISDSSSLHTYQMVKEGIGQCSYLNAPVPFKATQLKFKLRAGVLGLGADLYRQRRSSGMCKTCNVFESHKHFIMACPEYSDIRVKLYKGIRDYVDMDTFNLFLQNPNVLFLNLLGDHDGPLNVLFAEFLTRAWQQRIENMDSQ